MTIPIMSHTTSRSQVAAGKLAISPKETTTPMIGTKGTHGVLKGRGKSGRLRRKIQVPAETITKASSVPMLTSSPRMSMGTNAAKKATKIPTKIVESTACGIVDGPRCTTAAINHLATSRRTRETGPAT